MATPETPRVRSPSLRPALVTVSSLGCLAIVAAFVLGGKQPATGVAAGAGLAVANLWAFGRLGSGLLSAKGSKARWIALALGKLLVLFGLVVLLLVGGIVDPIPLALGYMAMPAGITLSYAVFRNPGLDRNRESA